MKYIIYKLLNALYLKFFKKFSYSDILFSDKNIELHKISCIFFDFSHNSTHLGDRLFFFPIIRELYKNGINVCLSKNDSISESLFLELDSSLSFKNFTNDDIKSTLIVLPAPSFLALKNKYKHFNIAICNFIEIKNRNIIEELDIGFSKILHKKISSSICLNFNNKTIDYSYIEDNNYYVYSNYIDSGWFRKYFINNKTLDKKASDLRNDGYKIIHVGSKKDLGKDKKIYNFIDLDLRGKLSIIELARMINDKNIVGVVAYDNFIMHLSGIFNKKTFVLFRGRFLRKNTNKHIKYINNAFFDINNQINYLK